MYRNIALQANRLCCKNLLKIKNSLSKEFFMGSDVEVVVALSRDRCKILQDGL